MGKWYLRVTPGKVVGASAMMTYRVMAAQSTMINYTKVLLFGVILFDKGSDKGHKRSLVFK